MISPNCERSIHSRANDSIFEFPRNSITNQLHCHVSRASTPQTAQDASNPTGQVLFQHFRSVVYPIIFINFHTLLLLRLYLCNFATVRHVCRPLDRHLVLMNAFLDMILDTTCPLFEIFAKSLFLVVVLGFITLVTVAIVALLMSLALTTRLHICQD